MLILYEFSWNILRNRVNELRHGWTSAQELRHQIWTSAQVINFGTPLFHGAEVNISIEIGAEVNIWCRSPQVGTEVTNVPKLLVPNIDCPLRNHNLVREFIMNLLSFWRINFKFTIFSRIYYLFMKKSLGISRINYEFTVCFENFLWIHYLFRGSTKNSFCVSRIHVLFREYFINSLSISRIHY